MVAKVEFWITSVEINVDDIANGVLVASASTTVAIVEVIIGKFDIKVEL